MLVDRDAFIKAGGFDSKYFLYLEGVDLSWRVKLLRYSIAFVPKARAVHYFSGSAGSQAITWKKLYYAII